MPTPENLLQIAQLIAHSRMNIWSEGSCALKISEEQILVSRRGANLGQLKKEDLLELSIPKLNALSAAETCSPEAVSEALGDLAPDSDAFLYAYFMGMKGAHVALHLHPVELNQILCSPRARQFADRRSLPQEVAFCGSASLLVPYADPGLPLAREVRRKMILWNDRYEHLPQVVLIQNNGLIVFAETTEEALKIAESTLKAAQVFIGASLLGGPVFLTPSNITALTSES